MVCKFFTKLLQIYDETHAYARKIFLKYVIVEDFSTITKIKLNTRLVWQFQNRTTMYNFCRFI